MQEAMAIPEKALRGNGRMENVFSDELKERIQLTAEIGFFYLFRPKKNKVGLSSAVKALLRLVGD
jgi:hypothetical protein